MEGRAIVLLAGLGVLSLPGCAGAGRGPGDVAGGRDAPDAPDAVDSLEAEPATPPPSSGDWPQYGRTSSNLFSSELDLSGTPILRWESELPGGVAVSYPVAAAGRAFLRMYGSGAAAVGLADGVLAWSDGAIGDGKYATYAVDGPLLYTANEADGTLYALAADSGETLWTLDLGGSTGFASPKVRDHVLFLGGKTLRAIDAATRQVLWTAEGVGFAATPAVTEDRVYATACRLATDPGPGDGPCADAVRLYAFERGTGAVAWQSAEALDGSRSAPAVVSSRIVVGGESTRCFDAATGELVWNAATGAGSKGSDFDSAPAVLDGRVFVVGAQIQSLDVMTGAVLWSHDGGNIRSTPVVAGNVVIVNDSASYSNGEDPPGRLVALDTAGTGDGTTTERWSWPVARGDSSPIVVDGGVLFASGNRLLFLGFP